MTVRWLLPVALGCVGPLAAQARVVPLPDTLGANFSIADSARRSAAPEDYDAVLGVWHLTFQWRQNAGTFGTPFTGHWTFRKRPGSRVRDRGSVAS